MQALTLQVMNVGILVAILVYYLRAPVRAFIEQRHVQLRDELKKIQSQLSTAREQYEEFSSKLKAIDAEVTALREQTKQDGEAMKLRLLDDTKRLSSNIVADARLAGESVFSELKSELRKEFGNKIIERAEVLLRDRLTGDDKVRIRREFSNQVEKAQ